jgi:hypothetical protein
MSLIKIDWYGLDRTIGGLATRPGFHAQIEDGFTAYVVTNRLHHWVIRDLGKLGMEQAIRMRFDQYRRSSLSVEFPMLSFWDVCTRISNEYGFPAGEFGQVWLQWGFNGWFRDRTIRDWIYCTKWMRRPWTSR